MNKQDRLLSIILPIYNEEGNIIEIINEIDNVLSSNYINYEVVLVDDGSKDNSWELIESVSKKRSNVKGYKLSRNFGKESAIFAGLEVVTGDAAVIMDSDLQHPPEVILDMYNTWIEKNADIVSGVKLHRGKESKIYGMCSKIFYKLLYCLTSINLEDGSDFKLLDRKIINILNQMNEKETFFRAMCMWVGFRNEEVKFTVKERFTGERKWGKVKLIKYAISGITQYTSYPLHWITYVGIVNLILATMLGIHTLYNKFFGEALVGFTTVILIVLLIGGILMISLGIIGQYLSLIYKEIKARPKYIISECSKDDKENKDKVHQDKLQVYK